MKTLIDRYMNMSAPEWASLRASADASLQQTFFTAAELIGQLQQMGSEAGDSPLLQEMYTKLSRAKSAIRRATLEAKRLEAVAGLLERRRVSLHTIA